METPLSPQLQLAGGTRTDNPYDDILIKAELLLAYAADNGLEVGEPERRAVYNFRLIDKKDRNADIVDGLYLAYMKLSKAVVGAEVNLIKALVDQVVETAQTAPYTAYHLSVAIRDATYRRITFQDTVATHIISLALALVIEILLVCFIALNIEQGLHTVRMAENVLVRNDAISIYFADATLASASVARWCVGSKVKTTGGVFQVRETQPGTADRRGAASDAVRASAICVAQLQEPSRCLVNESVGRGNI